MLHPTAILTPGLHIHGNHQYTAVIQNKMLSKKTKLKRQYAGSRIDLNLENDEPNTGLMPNKTTSRRNSMRRASTVVGMPSSGLFNIIENRKLKNDDEQDISKLRGKLENLVIYFRLKSLN